MLKKERRKLQARLELLNVKIKDCRRRYEDEHGKLEAEWTAISNKLGGRVEMKKQPVVEKPKAEKGKKPEPAMVDEVDLEVDITPAAAELAADNGIDVELVAGTGVDGRITVKDIRKFL